MASEMMTPKTMMRIMMRYRSQVSDPRQVMNGTSHIMDEMVVVMIWKAALYGRMLVTKVRTHSLVGTWLKVVFELMLNKIEDE